MIRKELLMGLSPLSAGKPQGPPPTGPEPPDDPEDLPPDPRDPRKDGWNWRPVLAGAAVAAGLAAAAIALGPDSDGIPTRLDLGSEIHVVGAPGGKLVYVPRIHRFAQPVDLRKKEIRVDVEIPPELAKSNAVVTAIVAKDADGREQATRWTEGQAEPNNPRFDGKVLRLRYQPTAADVDAHGHTDEGFDPSRISQVTVRFSRRDKQRFIHANFRVQEAVVEAAPLPPAPVVKPLAPAGALPKPLDPAQMVSGVSRYIVYGDLHRWEEAGPRLEKMMAQQQKAGLTGFRLMGGLDFRQGVKLGEPEFKAMREYVAMAKRYGQTNNVFTLLDGAIPNPTLEKALEDPGARKALVESFRPFVREFGKEPVVWDLVNEIHGTRGPEAAKQRLVEDLAQVFSEEAPGATLTVGVQNYRELKYWTYLGERFPDLKFMMSFHLYEPLANVPDRSELGIGEGMPVGITEADPGKGISGQVEEAARKGYDWLLFWTDANMPYNPAEHGKIVR